MSHTFVQTRRPDLDQFVLGERYVDSLTSELHEFVGMAMLPSGNCEHGHVFEDVAVFRFVNSGPGDLMIANIEDFVEGQRFEPAS